MITPTFEPRQFSGQQASTAPEPSSASLPQMLGRKLLAFCSWYNRIIQRGIREEIVRVDRLPLSAAILSTREYSETNS